MSTRCHMLACVAHAFQSLSAPPRTGRNAKRASASRTIHVSLSLSLYIYIYISTHKKYIYIYTYITYVYIIYIYIYIYPEGSFPLAEARRTREVNINECFPDRRHRNLKAFREHIQNLVYWFIAE